MMRSALAVGLTILLAGPAAAQQRQSDFEAWQPPVYATRAAATTVEPEPRDHRYEGLLIGGIAAGVLGAWMGSSISTSDCLTQPGGGCGRTDRSGTALVGGLVGAAFGCGLGYIIGRWGGGRPEAVPADSTGTAVGE